VPDESWVHNLEHGGVALLWSCDDCEAGNASFFHFITKVLDHRDGQANQPSNVTEENADWRLV
jgi:hypothetical protein